MAKEILPDIMDVHVNKTLGDFSGCSELKNITVSDIVLDDCNSGVVYDNDELDIIADVISSNGCVAESETRTKHDLAPVREISSLDLESTKVGRHEEVRTSDEEDFTIPCIRLSEAARRIRNDNGMSSDEDFHGYTYETSSDEENHAYSKHEVEKEEFSSKTDVHVNKTLRDFSGCSEVKKITVSDIILDDCNSGVVYDNDELDIIADVISSNGCGAGSQTRTKHDLTPVREVSSLDLESTKVGRHEEVRASDEKDFTIPHIHLSEAARRIRNDNGMSSDGDSTECRGYTYETSSDEDEHALSKHKVKKEEFDSKTGVHDNKVSGLVGMTKDSISDYVPSAGYHKVTYGDEESDSIAEVMSSNICATSKDVQTGITSNAAPALDSKSTTLESHEKNRGSDEEDFTIPCIHLSEDACRLRNDNSISSNGDFQDYSYESSTDEDIQNSKIDIGVMSRRRPSKANKCLSKTDLQIASDTQMYKGPVDSNNLSENSHGYTYETSSDDDENAHSQLKAEMKRTDVQDYSYEISEDEDIPNVQNKMEMASIGELLSEEYSSTDPKMDQDLRLDPEFYTGPTHCNSTYRSIKDVLCQPTLMSDHGEAECPKSPETSMRTAMMSNFMNILMEKEENRHDLYTHLNESNNSRGCERSPSQDSVEQDNYPPSGSSHDSSRLPINITESHCTKGGDVIDNAQIIPPPEQGCHCCSLSGVQLVQKVYTKGFQQPYGDKKKDCNTPADIKKKICVENKQRNTTNKHFTAKYQSKKEGKSK
ncbi:uncharacterized protein LOC117338542 [Pecten maximus]|uniref:uncharacterized protein LOC117338542 n=1 Tax=Pecten maximus TaxID=6579 RepID=UPI0014583B6A|nr:uncharacterized protein LOC117338542 [Pecten maximus]